ncbi:MAG: hypothetical protein QOD99_2645 [Chthoniobacter sp.]|jgi:hypothetical protein|nr:hypothetical protein [Chthoniobacter sp.]
MIDHTPAPPQAEVFKQSDTGNLIPLFLGAGALGLLVSGICAFIPSMRAQFAFSWLFAFMYFFTLVVGSLFWILVHHATDAEWSVVVRRVLENVAGLIPIVFIFFLPLLLCAPILWKWWTILPHADALLDKKRWYLNHGFFVLRVVLYFIGLTYVALSLKRNSTRQDADGNPGYTVAMRKLGIAGIPIFALSLTFGAVDWLMGLDYKWASTMWGVYIFAGAAGSSMSLLVLIITALRNKGYLANVVTLEHYHIMGKLMFAFSVFWAYIGFSQYMLIWYANIPEETSYFIRRNVESWWWLSLFLVIGRFFLPFMLLLLQWTKKVPKVLCCVAGWIVFMQLVDLYVVIMPMLHKEGFSPSFLDLFALLAIGGPLGYLFLRALSQHNLIPLRDPRLQVSLHLTN